MYTTFSKLKNAYDKKETAKSKNLFGTTVRFPDTKNSKSKSFLGNPGPDQYDLVTYWKGKEKKDEKTKNDWKNVSKGV